MITAPVGIMALAGVVEHGPVLPLARREL